MNIIQQVYDISEVILASEPTYVMINNDKVDELSKQMKDDGIPEFGNEGDRYKTGIHLEILKELVASSINYCYWYGVHDIRPNNVSSTSMYNDVEECFQSAASRSLMFEQRIDKLIRTLSIHRYPMLEERKRHLLELCEDRKGEQFTNMVRSSQYSPERLFTELIEMFQGFASDIFLKRASLFFIQLYRKFGWYKPFIEILHVPADYQVPKILRHFDCIKYNDELDEKIKLGNLIEKHSLMELQIRAATIKVCNKLQNATEWTIADVDTYLWCKRKISNSPFHLTYTTDY